MRNDLKQFNLKNNLKMFVLHNILLFTECFNIGLLYLVDGHILFDFMCCWWLTETETSFFWDSCYVQMGITQQVTTSNLDHIRRPRDGNLSSVTSPFWITRASGLNFHATLVPLFKFWNMEHQAFLSIYIYICFSMYIHCSL